MGPTLLHQGVDHLLPHGVCFAWAPWLMGLHIVSDFLIFLSYYVISLMIWRFIALNPTGHRRRLHLFALFILLCGSTHLFAIATLWKPWFIEQGAFKAITALISAITAIVVAKEMPKAKRLLVIEINE